MTENKLHKLYKLIAYFLIAVSLIFILTPIDNLLVQDKFGIVLIMNIGFHMFYHLISIVPLKQLNWVKDNSTVQNIAFKGIMVMSYFIPIACILASVIIITESFSNQEYYKLTVLLVLSGVILGALKLNLKLKSWRKNTLQQRTEVKNKQILL
ncbi:hypothetical protein [Maribacter sp. Hel_I_7]|uniref:hypothetical protein n=1 Tax=Maribacter sp. Hel_I_7 TaxID=1249997 RepID=UPI0012DCB516|nr:hypothetical protein [Maribacter sp. Hel_I_7]